MQREKFSTAQRRVNRLLDNYNHGWESTWDKLQVRQFSTLYESIYCAVNYTDTEGVKDQFAMFFVYKSMEDLCGPPRELVTLCCENEGFGRIIKLIVNSGGLQESWIDQYGEIYYLFNVGAVKIVLNTVDQMDGIVVNRKDLLLLIEMANKVEPSEDMDC